MIKESPGMFTICSDCEFCFFHKTYNINNIHHTIFRPLSFPGEIRSQQPRYSTPSGLFLQPRGVSDASGSYGRGVETKPRGDVSISEFLQFHYHWTSTVLLYTSVVSSHYRYFYIYCYYYYCYYRGHICGDHIDLINGRPTGSVRVSFGYQSSESDADRLYDTLYEQFWQKNPVKPLDRQQNTVDE